MSHAKPLFDQKILMKRVYDKVEEKYPAFAERYDGKRILEQLGTLGTQLAVELSVEVLCEEINEIRKELRRKI